MRLLLLLALASCATTTTLPPAPRLACDSPAPPPVTPKAPRTVERLARFAIDLELSREEANAALVECAAKLQRVQDGEHRGE